ncbi:MAG: hypothetical protein HPY79_06695 [Bacteroidales bacterium]|nr:hypothetical protein [Bacteroidales bacterium]
MHPDNQIIHSLWIGKELSPLELLTIYSFIANGHKFYLWIYESIETPLPQKVILKDANEIIPYSKVFKYKFANQYGHGKGSYAGFSDLFRYALLYQYGGWWVDMDVTCLKPFDIKEPYVFRSHHELKVVGNIIKCPPKSELMQNCYKDALFLIDEHNRNWNRPIEILNRNIVELNLESYIRSFTNPDKWLIIKKYLVNQWDIPEHYYAIHWVNEEWRRHKIAKNKTIANSFYASLLKKYNVSFIHVKGLQLINYKIKLTNLYSAMVLLKYPHVFFKTLLRFIIRHNKKIINQFNSDIN